MHTGRARSAGAARVPEGFVGTGHARYATHLSAVSASRTTTASALDAFRRAASTGAATALGDRPGHRPGTSRPGAAVDVWATGFGTAGDDSSFSNRPAS